MKYVKFIDSYYQRTQNDIDCSFIVAVKDKIYNSFIDFVEEEMETWGDNNDDDRPFIDKIDDIIEEKFKGEAEILVEPSPDYEIEW